MAVKTIGALADVQDAIYQALLAAGFTVTKPDGNNVKVDFSADTDWVNVNNSLWVQLRLNGSNFEYRMSLQPNATASFDNTKQITGESEGVAWTAIGAIGDTITYTQIAGFAAWCKNCTTEDLTPFSFVWKSTSPIDSNVRFMVGYYFNATYRYWKVAQYSPVVQDLGILGVARRTIMGDGISYQGVIAQVSNGMIVDRTNLLVPWRNDLSLVGNNFTLGADSYHYVGRWGIRNWRSGYAGEDYTYSLSLGFKV